jgi:hypothetical protein
MKSPDLDGPLSQFQATEGTNFDMSKLVGSLIGLPDKDGLSDSVLDRAIDAGVRFTEFQWGLSTWL